MRNFYAIFGLMTFCLSVFSQAQAAAALSCQDFVTKAFNEVLFNRAQVLAASDETGIKVSLLNREVIVRDSNSGELTYTKIYFDEVSNIRVLSKAKRLVIEGVIMRNGSPLLTSVEIFDLLSKTIVESIPAVRGSKITVSDDGAMYVTSDTDRTFVTSVDSHLFLWGKSNPMINLAGVREVEFSPDSKVLFVRGYLKTQVYDARTGKLIYNIANSQLRLSAQNSKLIVLAKPMRRAIEVRDLATGRILVQTKIPNGTQLRSSPILSEDLGVKSGTIKLNIETTTDVIAFEHGATPIISRMQMIITMNPYSETIIDMP